MPRKGERGQPAHLRNQHHVCPNCGKTGGNGIPTHIRYCGGAKDRFWAKAMPLPWSGCWIFMGCIDKWGYGQHGYQNKRNQAHRLAYEWTKGPIPAGMLVMHSCDTPACVNPAHLQLGTDADNCADKIAKGRANNMVRAKVRKEDVLEIRRRYVRGYPGGERGNAVELAALYGVTRGTIVLIANGQSWAHVK